MALIFGLIFNALPETVQSLLFLIIGLLCAFGFVASVWEWIKGPSG